MTFKTGDIVTHVLGGPRMQVTTVHSEKQVSCFWFDGHNVPHTEGFLTANLVMGFVPAPSEDAAKPKSKKAAEPVALQRV